MAAEQAASATTQAASTLSPMQQALLDRADSIFASIGSTVSKASDLALQGGKAVADQIPDIAMQYVAYGRAISTLTEVLSIVGVVFFWYCLFYRKTLMNAGGAFKDDKHGDWTFPRFIVSVISGICGGISLIIAINNLSDLIMVWFAPKVWLLLELAHLVKHIHG